MPQPLKRGVDISWQPADLVQRAELLGVIGQISSVWSYIELPQMMLFHTLMGSKGLVGVQIYTSLTGTAARIAALSTAFDSCSTPYEERFRTLLRDLKARAIERNNVVHSLWGVSDAYPEALIGCPPDHLALHVANESQIASLLGTVGLQLIPDKVPRPAPGTMVYRLSDFREIKKRMRSAVIDLLSLTEDVRAHLTQAHQRNLAQMQRLQAVTGARAAPDTTPELPAQNEAQPRPSPER